MKTDKEMITKISKLSRLTLSEKEISKFSKEFDDILEYFKVLDQCDISETKSSFTPVEEKNHLREDKIEPTVSQDQALSFTENKKDGFIVGPRTVKK